MPDKKTNPMPPAQSLSPPDLVDYADASVVSRTLLKSDAGTITLFAFDADQGLSEHTAPFDALVQVLEGRADISIGSRTNRVEAGHAILLPANVPHALHAPERFKMILTMLRK